MTAKHADPEYRKNSRIIRQQVKAKRGRGDDVTCWRCGRPIGEDQAYDVGHIDASAGHGMGNLAPEHQRKSPWCRGNRSAGGALGAAMTNSRHRTATGRAAASAALLPW